MSKFSQALDERQPARAGDRRWLFVPYDQLHDGIGPLAHEPAADLGIVLVESRAKAERRAYHKQKLALVLANLRHFALEQAARGVVVRHVATDAARAVLRAPREGIPYHNARPHLRIGPEDLDDPGHMARILALTVANLPKKAAKKR